MEKQIIFYFVAIYIFSTFYSDHFETREKYFIKGLFVYNDTVGTFFPLFFLPKILLKG